MTGSQPKRPTAPAPRGRRRSAMRRAGDPSPVIVISACLLGLRCTYDDRPGDKWEAGFDGVFAAMRAAKWSLVPVCPEQLGGLPTPRPPAELQDPVSEVLAGRGRLLNNRGEEVTAAFRRGAEEALLIAHRYEATAAIMRDRSPSCGRDQVMAGDFSGRRVQNHGVTAALFMRDGIAVIGVEAAIDAFAHGGLDALGALLADPSSVTPAMA